MTNGKHGRKMKESCIFEGNSDNRNDGPSRLSHRSELAKNLSADVAADQYQLCSTPATGSTPNQHSGMEAKLLLPFQGLTPSVERESFTAGSAA